ncbi:hypothetical protein K502DRAFT_322652 [Neoconidiobolus thromboides FSU 785]|nr:hypothetical protein K502DRAFT_322652 [Neoconidiobolus thromboides FSU 785]
MQKKLKGAKFRMLNEMLYTTRGEEAYKKFQKDPTLFNDYHEGFRSQVESWPKNPVDIFISQINQCKPNTVIADMGCGEAELSLKAPNHVKVHSFDLVAANPRITACDITNTPLKDSSVDIVIFSLSLMGTNYGQFLKEANRILKPKGTIKIAEVISRFESIPKFTTFMREFGYKMTFKDESNKMFVLMDFVKLNKDIGTDSIEAPTLKPCIYKRR